MTNDSQPPAASNSISSDGLLHVTNQPDVIKHDTAPDRPGEDDLAPVAQPGAPPASREVVEHALYLASHGLRIHTIPPGLKYPGQDDWPITATTDPATIGHWYSNGSRGHGVCIVTGWQPNDRCLFVVDVDNKNGHTGDDSWYDLQAEHGQAPDTVRAITPGGGTHNLFWADREVRNDQSGDIGDGLDVRGQGGQIVASPSKYKDDPNLRYEWEDGHAPGEIEIADAPEWLIDLVTKTGTTPTTDGTATTGDPNWETVGTQPGDRYAAANSWEDILTPLGFTRGKDGRTRGEERWARPGKTVKDGIALTVNIHGTDAVKMFSSSCGDLGLQADQTYSKLGFLVATKFDGDFRAAIRWCAEQYPTTSTIPPNVDPETGEVLVEWEEPVAFGDRPRPPFPVDALPPKFAEVVNHIAATRNVDPALPAQAYLGAIAGIMGRKVKVQISLTWASPITLYTVAITKSGDGKSPGFGPAEDLVERISATLEEAAAGDRSLAKARLAITRGEYKAALKVADGAKPNEREVDKLGAKVAELEAEVRKVGRITVGDATPEAMVALLGANGGHIAMVDDEGTVLQHAMGMYATKPNIGLLLKAYDGRPYAQDRVKTAQRPESQVVIPSLSIGFAVAVQPIVITELLNNRQATERGLAARALLAYQRTKTGTRMLQGMSTADDSVVNSFHDLVDLLFFRRFDAGTVATLSPDALDVFKHWHDELEVGLLDADDAEARAVPKVRGSVPRIAVVLQLLDDMTVDVTAETMRAACRLGEYYLAHITALENLGGPTVDLATKIVAYLHGRPDPTATATVRDVTQSCTRRTVGSTELVIGALWMLSELGWVAPADPLAGFGGGGRAIGKKAAVILVNPKGVSIGAGRPVDHRQSTDRAPIEHDDHVDHTNTEIEDSAPRKVNTPDPVINVINGDHRCSIGDPSGDHDTPICTECGIKPARSFTNGLCAECATTARRATQAAKARQCIKCHAEHGPDDPSGLCANCVAEGSGQGGSLPLWSRPG